MCDLNPTAQAWSKVKNYVRENVAGDLSEAAAGLNNRRNCNCDCKRLGRLLPTCGTTRTGNGTGLLLT
jgi:hypothetical protein